MPIALTETAATTDLSGFLSTVDQFFSQSLSWLGDVMGTIGEHPALTIMVLAMPIGGFAVGLLGRLIRL